MAIVTLRDILCGAMSLDDGLSAIQNISRRREDDVDLAFEIARAVEEILLRRPGIASAKLTELSVRLSFRQDRTLPQMLQLLDTRFTTAHRREESELLPDVHAIPVLLDILGDLTQSMYMAMSLNLRPLLPFLTDEALLTLEALFARGHEASTRLAIHESHYAIHMLLREGMFDCADVLLNRLIGFSQDMDMEATHFDVSLDEAAVLTELGMYQQSRTILHNLADVAKKEHDSIKLADVTLQLAINETRDDAVHHKTARALADTATSLFREAVNIELASKDDLGFAYLLIGSNILANGWFEGVPEAIERLEECLSIYEDMEGLTQEQNMHLYRCLAALGFAHGLQSDHRNITLSLEYLSRARSILEQIEDAEVELSVCEHSIGWLCLGCESNELWDTGIEAFERAVDMRKKLLGDGKISELVLLGSQIGLELSRLRKLETPIGDDYAPIRSLLVQYTPLFPTDTRAFTEVAIATYNTVWLTLRHGGSMPHRFLRLLDDIDRMLSDARATNDDVFIDGVALVVPFMNNSWLTLRNRCRSLASQDNGIMDVVPLMQALAISKLNLDAVKLEMTGEVTDPVTQSVQNTDPLLAQYWRGQTGLAKTLHLFYRNRDYSELASGLYDSAVKLQEVEASVSSFDESLEFIKATALSLSSVLFQFALVLENRYSAKIDRTQQPRLAERFSDTHFSFILSDDWLGLIKITEAYLQMVDQSETLRSQPYLNAIFSNMARALKMMDDVAMVDRRVLAFLGEEMSRRFYIRR